MKRLILLIGFAALMATIISTMIVLTPTPCLAQSGCGVKPVKPVRPVGCKDLVARCQCDAQGKNCKWTWDCVR